MFLSLFICNCNLYPYECDAVMNYKDRKVRDLYDYLYLVRWEKIIIIPCEIFPNLNYLFLN